MKDVVLSSLRWLVAGRFLAQFGTWIITIIVIRLLSPGDYGLMALASMFIGFFALFEELGLSAAIVNKESLGDDNIRDIFGLLIAFSTTVYLVVVMAAGAVAAFFGEPQLEAILKVLALKVPIAAMASVPNALLQRNMQFRRKSIVEFVSAMLGSLLTLTLAFSGYGVWSLVYGTLCRAAASAFGLWLGLGRFHLPTFNFHRLLADLRFGGLVSLDRFLWYLSSQADVFFIGKFLGKETLGIYAVAMQLATLPMQKVSQILNEVGFAAFSRIQSDRADVRYKLLLAAGMVSFVAFPVFFGIAAVSFDLVPALLGDDWAGVTIPLLLIPLIVPLQMLNSLTATVLFGTGRPGRAAGNSLIALTILAPAFGLAAYFGDIVAVCVVWLACYPAYFLIVVARTLPHLGISLRDFFGCIMRPAAFALTMYFAVVALQRGISPQIGNPALSLAIIVAFGAMLHLSLVWFFDRATLTRFIDIVRS